MIPRRELKMLLCDHADIVSNCCGCGHSALREFHRTAAEPCTSRYCVSCRQDVRCNVHIYRLDIRECGWLEKKKE